MVRRQKRRNGLVGTAVALTGVSVTTSVGAKLATNAGGSAAGLSTFASFTPALGVIGGSIAAVRGLENLRSSTRKKKGKR